MLEKPNAGWCDIVLLGYHIESASYLADYPLDIADALFAWEDGKESFFVVELEERGWLTVKFSQDNMEVWEAYAEDDAALFFSHPISPEIIIEMKQELAFDIENNFDEWVAWTACETEERVLRRLQLSAMARKLLGKSQS